MKKYFVTFFVTAAFLAAMFVTSAVAAELFAVSAQYEGSNAEIYRYQIDGPNDHPTAPDLIISTGSSQTSSPAALAFSPWNEMFVFDRGPGGNAGAAGSIQRYLDPTGPAPVYNGSIVSNSEFSFATPHWGSFRGNELFIAQRYGVVDRFLFDDAGTAKYNGQIQVASGDGPRGAKVSPWGELFVTVIYPSQIQRYLISPDGTAVLNGVIAEPDLAYPHDLAFSPWGEMFVVAGATAKVIRYTFEDGVAVRSGEIYSPEYLSGSIGIAFAPWGEIFVSHHTLNQISRWKVGPNDRAEFNGILTTPVGGVIGLGDVEFFLPKGRR